MKVNLTRIRSQFDAILMGTIEREQVADWARKLREASDREELAVKPESDWEVVWKAILFLEGVDLKDAPDSYLHNEEDILREKP